MSAVAWRVLSAKLLIAIIQWQIRMAMYQLNTRTNVQVTSVPLIGIAIWLRRKGNAIPADANEPNCLIPEA